MAHCGGLLCCGGDVLCTYVCIYVSTSNLTQTEHVTSFSSSDTIHDEEHSGSINLVPGSFMRCSKAAWRGTGWLPVGLDVGRNP